MKLVKKYDKRHGHCRIYVPHGEPTEVIAGYSGTTVYDWFIARHPTGSGLVEVSSDTDIFHGSDPADLADPACEPLDVIILHVLVPRMERAGSVTPKSLLDSKFLLLQYNFDNLADSKALLSNISMDREVMRRGSGCVKSTSDFKDLLINGFTVFDATEFFTIQDIVAFSKKFKSRIRKQFKTPA